MANEIGQRNGQTSDSDAEIQRLTILVEQMQREREELCKKLAESEALRVGYVKHIYELMRMAGIGKEYANMDISDFEAMSAGPVEMLE